MFAWEATLQGRTIVLDLEHNGLVMTIPFDRDDADELAQRLIELVIESDLDDCDDRAEVQDSWVEPCEDDEDEAA